MPRVFILINALVYPYDLGTTINLLTQIGHCPRSTVINPQQEVVNLYCATFHHTPVLYIDAASRVL